MKDRVRQMAGAWRDPAAGRRLLVVLGAGSLVIGIVVAVRHPTPETTTGLLAVSGFLLFVGIFGDRIRSIRVLQAEVAMELLRESEAAKAEGDDERAEVLRDAAAQKATESPSDRASDLGSEGVQASSRAAAAYSISVLAELPYLFALEVPVPGHSRTRIDAVVRTPTGTRVAVELFHRLSVLSVRGMLDRYDLLIRAEEFPADCLLVVTGLPSALGTEVIATKGQELGIPVDLIVWNVGSQDRKNLKNAVDAIAQRVLP
jgi:hypothetical protein